ncbi:MAG TPA: hypothetical protein VHX65_13115 [Pirellulales bacterium]|jgi:uncharacterized membrane protein|nr:hypothetical protein [Pirellulales bacterium]
MHYTFLDALGLIFRWMHILAAMAAVGGPMFICWALLPAAEALPDGPHRQLKEGIRLRWSVIVRIAIMFLLLSGAYNYLAFMRASRAWDAAWQNGPAHLYQALFGVKFLLALAIFFLASALTGRSPALARFRENARFWVAVNLALGIVLVGISGQMRMLHIGPPPATIKAAPAAATASAPHGTATEPHRSTAADPA